MYFGCWVSAPGNAECSDGSPITLGNDVINTAWSYDVSDCYEWEEWDSNYKVKPYTCDGGGGVCESPLSKTSS